LAALALAACSPALDWHSVPLPGTQLVAELPCRPGRFERDVTVAGLPLKLYMLSCEAGGVTYGVATAEVGDPARVDAVLRALHDGAAAAIRSADSPAGALNMRGATPFSGNSSAHLHGRRPDGEEVEEAIRVFGRGTRVFQASAVGARLPRRPCGLSRMACTSTWQKAWPTPYEHQVGASSAGKRAKPPRNAATAAACGLRVLGLPSFQADNLLFASFQTLGSRFPWPLYC
jgi:hypothetical protein